MINSIDYKTMGMLFIKYNIRRFLVRHGVDELDESALLSIAMDIFKGESSKEVESIKLYIALMRNSNILIGNYTNNSAAKRAEVVGGLIAFVTKTYNLLVRLYSNGLYTEYRELIAYIDDVDVLCKNIPGNIDYDKLAKALSKLYLEDLLKVANKIETNCKKTEN